MNIKNFTSMILLNEDEQNIAQILLEKKREHTDKGKIIGWSE